ncbi:MAG: hypothetical protein ACREH8_15755 [Opitutaceae bacterium]
MIQDFRNVRTRSGAGLKLDYTLSGQVRLFAKYQLNKHIETHRSQPGHVADG